MRRIALLLVAVVALAGCRVDVTVDVAVQPDGSGTITVVAVADAELVERVPDLAEQLALGDAVAAGWQVNGPTPTAQGGLTITLSHEFRDAAEATNLLASIGPPIYDPELGRSAAGDVTTNRLTARLGLVGSAGTPGGFDAFADSDLIATVGSVPFAAQFTQAGATPANSMSVVLRAQLPGSILDDRTNATEADGALVWEVPLDGTTIVEASAYTEQSPAAGRGWARPLSIVALIALVAWVLFMGGFIAFVAFARSRRASEYRRRHSI